jgi:hypothetical protein
VPGTGPVPAGRDDERRGGRTAAAAKRGCVTTEVPEPDEPHCPDCGASVAPDDARAHECDPDDVLDYRLFLDRVEPVTLNEELTAYLASPRGQFEAWYAERERQRGGHG